MRLRQDQQETPRPKTRNILKYWSTAKNQKDKHRKREARI